MRYELAAKEDVLLTKTELKKDIDLVRWDMIIIALPEIIGKFFS
ncbi:hypothetical protein ACPB8Q_06650 [Methanocaldococcus indicus]